MQERRAGIGAGVVADEAQAVVGIGRVAPEIDECEVAARRITDLEII
jgi:translation initiation factor 6 (eIF-6)